MMIFKEQKGLPSFYISTFKPKNVFWDINYLQLAVILFLVTKYAALTHRPSDLYTNTAISEVKKSIVWTLSASNSF